MIEVVGDIFDYRADYYCVTTNGMITKSGRAVMGAGIAKYFKNMFDGIDLVLAGQLLKNGNNVNLIWGCPTILSFPTKDNWIHNSSLSLIEKSLNQLIKYDGVIILPRPGCSNGGLRWHEDVKPLCEKYLTSDRFLIVNKKPS